MALISETFFKEAYGGVVTDGSFKRLLFKAETFLNKRTFGQIIQNESGEYGQMVHGEFLPFTNQELTALKYGLCGLVEALDKLEKAELQALEGNENTSNVKSRSSGGESISYEVHKTIYDEAIMDPVKKTELLRSVLMEYVRPEAFRYNPFYAGSW